MTESWREREHNFIFWFKRIVRCLLSKLKITRLFSSTIFQNCIQVCIATPSSLVLFVSYFLSLPMEICFWLLLPIQVYVFQTVSHFAILIQLCIFMSFTTMSCPYFHNCQVFFFFFWSFRHPFGHLQHLLIISVELISAFVVHLSRSPMQMLN